MQTSAQPLAAPACDPANQDFLDDATAGLRASPKQIPSKYFYDKRGSELFDAICGLDEYYPTRTELGIMAAHGAAMAEALGAGCMLIELGSGSSVKTRILLRHMAEPKVYVPVDIARDHLAHTVRELAAEHDGLEIVPVCADFGKHFVIPAPATPVRRRVVYFPGSTLGNFEAAEAEALLARIAAWAGPGGGLLIGFDTCADRALLEAAYDDRQGVTAAFNLNLLQHANRELGADFKLDGFKHRAEYDEPARRVVMWLDSLREQDVTLAGEVFHFAKGESMRTEYSHKYDLDTFARNAARAGLALRQAWTDARGLFAVALLEVEA